MAEAVKEETPSGGTTIRVKMTVPYALRELAKAIDRQEKMKAGPGMTWPADVRFFHGEKECLEYGSNPTLLAAIGDEIRKRWPELRAAAFASVEAEIADWSGQLAPVLAHLADPENVPSPASAVAPSSEEDWPMDIATDNPTVRFISGPTILLQSGAYFDLTTPEQCDFTIQDIAHGLAMTCRFAGQCRHFYSVAQHSVLMSELVPPEDALAALMHDAAEAFIGDMAKPLKVLLPQYKEIEKRIEAAIFNRFGIANPLPPSIKEADVRMLATEQRQVMRNRDDWDYTRGRQSFDIVIDEWPPAEAKMRFLRRFNNLYYPF